MNFLFYQNQPDAVPSTHSEPGRESVTKALTVKALTRREFLRSATESARDSLLILSTPTLLLAGQQAHAAMAAGEAFTALAADEAIEFAAIAARIIPTDETPGANEAGVIYFMDRILDGSRAEFLPGLRQGLAELQQSVVNTYGNTGFSSLTEDQQDSLLRTIDRTDFFNTLHYLTIAGMFSSPALGGNRDRIGWQLLGFEARHAWMPPYGYYDAQQMETGE